MPRSRVHDGVVFPQKGKPGNLNPESEWIGQDAALLAGTNLN